MNEDQKNFIKKDNINFENLKRNFFPSISLPNQDGNFLRLNREDTFRMVIYFFSMTGRPDRPLPQNWNQIPGAKGCTLQTCSFRDNYDEIISLNAIPIGISTQTIEDNKEMTSRLSIPFDILSDEHLELTNLLNLSIFTIEKKDYLRRTTIIVENNVIKKIFYPIYEVEKHVEDVLQWLKEN